MCIRDSPGAYPLPGRRADLIDTGVVHMKAETTVDGPQTSSKMASTGTRQAATSSKRDEGGIAPRKSASGGIMMASVAGNGKCQITTGSFGWNMIRSCRWKRYVKDVG